MTAYMILVFIHNSFLIIRNKISMSPVYCFDTITFFPDFISSSSLSKAIVLK